MESSFEQRKKDVLSKLDKSSKGIWDEKIISLCEKINSKQNYYTTSSCSGKVVIMIDQDKKENNLFLHVWHNLISSEELKKSLKKISLLSKSKKQIKFKMESCILHIACRTLEDAQNLLDEARAIGWKRSGIIVSKNRFFLELNSTEKLEFPICRKGKILVSDGFLEIIAKEANKKLEKCWGKIEKLEKVVSKKL